MTGRHGDLSTRFWAKVKKAEGCWLWAAATNKRGYGRIQTNNGVQLAHRVSWKLRNGAIPPDLQVCHHCDTPACIRPDHLFLGTNADNCADMKRKGRARNGGAAGTYRGEMIHTAVLSEAQVREMCSRFSADKRGDIPRAARAYGIGKSAAHAILRRKSWRHVHQDAVANTRVQSELTR